MRGFVFIAVCLVAVPALAQETQDRAGAAAETFFETKIRPVLAGKCFKCHGAQKSANGLRVDSREGLLRGGKNGAAIVPGEPEKSLLVDAIRYGERQMPPDKELPDDVVADFERWIEQGAVWPETIAKGTGAASGEHWAFRPVRSVAAPIDFTEADGLAKRIEKGDRHLATTRPGGEFQGSLGASPLFQQAAIGPVDAFLLAELERHGLRPNPPAEKRTLIRRATFDLIGVPPSVAEVDAFLADDSPDAFGRVVDRLLASPLYGQRWGRHWLDLVRYTDDFEESWRYRDWVVDAFNADLPYDEFVRRQIAGDLLPGGEPGVVNAEGIVATTMLSLGPWSGIDRKKRLTDIADDQIDTVSRTFLGLTIACARCHDHKFDPITTADYYGLAGIFFSSHVISDEAYLSHGTARLKIPLVGAVEVERHQRLQADVRTAEQRLQAAVDRQYGEFARSLLPETARYLLAAWDFEHRPADHAKLSADEFAARENLHGFALNQWVSYLKAASFAPYQLLDVPERDFDGEPGVLAWRVRAERPWWAVNTNEREVPIETFCLPPRTLSINPGTEGGAVRWKSPYGGSVRITGKLSDDDPLDGVGAVWAIDHIRSGTRHELSSGLSLNGEIKLEDGRTPERLAALDVQPGDEIVLQIRLRQGDAHYDITSVEMQISALDGTVAWDLTRDVMENFLESNPHGDRLGNAAVWQFEDMAGSHRFERMPAVDPLLERWRAVSVKSNDKGADATAVRRELEESARELQQAIESAGPESALVHDLIGPRSPFWVKTRDDKKYLSAESQADLAAQSAEVEASKRNLPPLPSAHGIREGGLRHSLYPGMQDAPVHVRGSYDQFGTVVPRRFPDVLTASEQSPIHSGSGRLELARWLASADNPLTARVMVNRLWQHHFGEGIVRTPSNFGALGASPTHPELLDFLATRFIDSGWSIKAMHRLMMLSAAYRQSTRTSPENLKGDPENRFFGRMNRRRPDAEAIHDALLAVAGRLNAKPGGAAETDPLSPRRLLYLKTTRTTRSGMGPLFDSADASMHVERRTVSTIAPQALYLMNDTWIGDIAGQVAARSEIAGEADPSRRIQALYELLFGRDPTPAEMELGRGFVERANTEPLEGIVGSTGSPERGSTGSPGPGSKGSTPEQGSTGSPGQGAAAPVEPWGIYTQALILSNEFMTID